MLECFSLTPELQFGSNCYILKSNNEYCVIDPSVSYKEAIEQVGDIKGSVKYIILTHSHFDHILSLDDWIENTGVLPSISKNGMDNVKNSKINCYRLFFGIDKAYLGDCNALTDGDRLTLGDQTLKIVETPGHTNCSICIITDDFIFSGDTVFSGGSYGRCDLPTGNRYELSASLERILSYEDKIIYSGHGEPTTVSRAKEYRYL